MISVAYLHDMPTAIGVFAVLPIHFRRGGIYVETSRRDVLSIMARIFEVDVPSRFKDVLIMSFRSYLTFFSVYLTIRVREISTGFIGSIIIILYNDTNLNIIIIYVTVSHDFAAIK